MQHTAVILEVPAGMQFNTYALTQVVSQAELQAEFPTDSVRLSLTSSVQATSGGLSEKVGKNKGDVKKQSGGHFLRTSLISQHALVAQWGSSTLLREVACKLPVAQRL